MSAKPAQGRSPACAARRAARASLALAAVVALAAAAGCGSSSKPAYCEDRTNLGNSVKSPPSAASSSGVSGLQSQLTTIQTDATAAVNTAKSDFPNETSALKSLVDTISSAARRFRRVHRPRTWHRSRSLPRGS